MHVPGWHEATRDLQDDGEIQMLGIIQEQHPDRASLFMQWKEMGWPILVDSYNLLEAPYVPITVAVDERGVITSLLGPLRDEWDLGEDFVRETFASSATPVVPGVEIPDLETLGREAASVGTADSWRAFGDAVAVWGGDERIDEAIDAYREVVRLAPDDGVANFRLGVAYRMRYDSDHRRDEDFQNAVGQWGAALDIDPNQYIWRRRIGPRLDKPYPFYDWVPIAREEIAARGEEPARLVVEPRGSEFAQPIEIFAAAELDASEPDPMGRVLRDESEFITIETVAVPAVVSLGESARFHVIFEPIVDRLAHWNNEAEDMVLWVDPPPGWEIDNRMNIHPLPGSVVSQETRTMEVELLPDEDVEPGSVTIPAYALYYVCEDVNGICMYRRQDLALTVAVKR